MLGLSGPEQSHWSVWKFVSWGTVYSRCI